jgi:hypothetical protein
MMHPMFARLVPPGLSVLFRLAPIAPISMISAVAWAQAEAAPPEPEPAPVPPAPPVAEPEPEPSPPPSAPAPVAAEAASPLDFFLGISGQGTRRVGDAADTLGPKNGFGVSMAFVWIYARPAGFELSPGGGFAYQRFRELVGIDAYRDNIGPLESERSFNYYEFALRQTVTQPIGPVRPYLSAGIGLALAYFSTREPAYAPGELRTSRPIVPVALGVDFVTGRSGGRLGLELGAAFLLAAPDLTTNAGLKVAIFGHRAHLGLTFRQPF